MGGGPFLWPGPNSPASFFGGGFPGLRSAQIVAIGPIALGNGENDIYTVPTGKRASISYSVINIATAANIAITPQIKNGGNYYNVAVQQTINNNVTTVISNAFNTIPILEQGESFAINTGASGLVLTGFVVIFDNTEPLSSPKLLTLASGNNTIYTCPAGKVAFNGNWLSGSSSLLKVANSSSGTRTYSWNAVPAGGSVAQSNQLIAAFTQANTATANVNAQNNSYASVAATGFYSINSDSSASGQVAWIQNLLTVPAP